jgi:adenine deaminase
MPRRHTIIRNGRLVNTQQREGYAADVLIEDDTIVAIGLPLATRVVSECHARHGR